MIEVRMNLVDLARIKHDMLHSIAMVERMKKAGIPVIGILIMRGVSRGRLTWHTEEDLDGDISVLRWYDKGEDSTGMGHQMVRAGGEKHEGWEWIKYVHPADLDDEL
jgi:hypothetical protein